MPSGYKITTPWCARQEVALYCWGYSPGGITGSMIPTLVSGHRMVLTFRVHYIGAIRWRKDPLSTWTEMALFWSLFTGGSFLVDFLKNEIVEFDENLAVVL